MMAYVLCDFCKRLKDFELGEYDKVIAHCEAYPEGIPEAVVYAGHLYPKPDDNGLQFLGEVPDNLKKSRVKENREYRELKKYYKELDMSDDEWIKYKQESEKLSYEEAEMLLAIRNRREDEPKIW